MPFDINLGNDISQPLTLGKFEYLMISNVKKIGMLHYISWYHDKNSPELFCKLSKVHSFKDVYIFSEAFFTNTHCRKLSNFTGFHVTCKPLHLRVDISVYVIFIRLTKVIIFQNFCHVRSVYSPCRN